MIWVLQLVPGSEHPRAKTHCARNYGARLARASTFALVSLATALERHSSGQVQDTVERLGANGAVALPPAKTAADLDAAINTRVHTIWDLRMFEQANPPLEVARLSDGDIFSAPRGLGKVSDMPIKFPGSDYRVPLELAPIAEALAIGADHEAKVNQRLADYYAYLTLDQAPVIAGEVQRGGGAHSDSVQGPRVQPKTFIEHGYVCSDAAPTAFYAQAFDMGALDPDVDWLNAAFEAQKRADAIVRPPVLTVLMFDAYCVHEAMPAETDGMRTFMRLIYSVRVFDRQGNTHNDLFDYDWEMRPRPFPDTLRGLER